MATVEREPNPPMERVRALMNTAADAYQDCSARVVTAPARLAAGR